MPKIPVRQRNTIQEVQLQIDAPKGFSAAKTLHNEQMFLSFIMKPNKQ